MNASSASFLIRCSDENFYVVKFARDPSRPDGLVKEMLGTVLARAAKLPVALGCGISITPSFLERTPELQTSTPVEPEKHYGSRFVGEMSGPGRTIQYLCDRSVAMVSNRSDFLGMYIFDVWANQQRRREALFVRTTGIRCLRGVFISHGGLFGNPRAPKSKDNLVACHWRSSLYSGLWSKEAVASWIRTFQTVLPTALKSTLAQIPSHWRSGYLDAQAIALQSRLIELPSLIEAHSLENRFR